MISTKHTHNMLTNDELARLSRQLKIPLKHLTEYHRFMHGHPTTKLAAGTKRFIRERMSAPLFRAMDDAVGLQRNEGTSRRTTTQ